MKKALIVGHSGQDGTYLYERLDKLGYLLLGISTRSFKTNSFSTQSTIDITDKESVNALLQSFAPTEIYFLAAAHQSSTDIHSNDHELFDTSIRVNVLALGNFLNGIRSHLPSCRLFYAASSHVFGNPPQEIQNEATPLNPNCIYGITKTAGIHLCRFYYEKHQVYASIGIFYNHESPLRPSRFVTKKIVESAVAIKYNKLDKLSLGSLSAQIDWGYAPDYMEAVQQIMQLPLPDTFIVCSGKTHSVQDFVEHTFNYLNLDWRKFVGEKSDLIKKMTKGRLQGDYSKLHKATGWQPITNFHTMIEKMVTAELKKYDSA